LLKAGLEVDNLCLRVIAFNCDTFPECNYTNGSYADASHTGIPWAYTIQANALQENMPGENTLGNTISVKAISCFAGEYDCKTRYKVIYLEGIFYIVVFFTSAAGYRYQADFCKDFKYYLEDRLKHEYGMDFIVSIGVGNLCCKITEIRESAEKARIALNYKYYKGKGNIIFYEEIKAVQAENDHANYEDNKKNLDIIIDNIIEVVFDKNTCMLLPALKKLFSYFISLSILDHRTLCIKCMQIYLAIVNKIKDKYDCISPFSEDEFYNRIVKYGSFDEMTKEFYNSILDLKNQVSDYNNTSDKSWLVQKIKKYIDENYSERLSLEQLSENFFLSPSYLSKIFKEETNVNVSEYIQAVRITHAKKLLKNTNYKIQDISRQVGYEDYRHFCTIFKKVAGITPLQYRIKTK